MNRYVRAAVCAAIGVMKTGVLKIERGAGVKFSAVNLISPMTEITVDKGGRLSVGKLMKMRSGSKLRVRKGAKVSIGERFSMGNRCVLTAYESVSIGSDVQFGPGVLVYDHDHDFRAEGGLKAKKYKTAPISIGNNVWIGANVIILRGTIIGDNCVVAAGSVIKGEYPPNTLIVQKRETTETRIRITESR